MINKIEIREVNRLAIPSMLAGITEPLIGIADTAIIGHVPENSAEALAGIGIAAGFFLFMFWTFVQIETALSAIVAKYYGEGKVQSLQNLIMQALVLNLIIGLFLWLASSVFLENIFDCYNAVGLQKKYAMEYFDIRSMGFPVVLVMWSIWGTFRGLQNTSWAMYIMISGGLVNLVLDFLFVFGVDGYIPAMGVEGAAWATLIAQVLMLLLSVVVMLRKTPFRFKIWKSWHPEFGRMLGMGGSFIVRTVALNVVLFVASASATEMSPQIMAAHAIAMQLWLLSAFLIDGYANAGLALAGRLLGEMRWDAIADLTKRLVKIGFVVAAAIMLVYTASYPWIGSWFSNEIRVVEQFSMIFIFVILGQPLSALAFTLDGFLKGLGAARYLMIMMIVALGAFYLAILFCQNYELGFQGVWISLLVWMLLRAVWPFFYLKRRFKRELAK